jgi:hypothetical protein
MPPRVKRERAELEPAETPEVEETALTPARSTKKASTAPGISCSITDGAEAAEPASEVAVVEHEMVAAVKEEEVAVMDAEVAHAASAPSAAEVECSNEMAREVVQLTGDISTLEEQLKGLQAEHARITIEHATISSALPKNRPPHDPSWEQHTNPTSGAAYFFNKRTNVSSYERPPDYNPRPKAEISPVLNIKGPPGANLFVVRKMRRGDFDDFDETDLRVAFGKYGKVLRCEVTVDPQTGWSRGFGFVSMSSPDEAARVIQLLNGNILAGREMKVELTKEDGSR